MIFQCKPDCRLAIESAYLADRLRQKLYIKYDTDPPKLTEFFELENIKDFPILMAIFNQVSAIPMIRPINRYLKYHIGDDILLLDGKKSLIFTLISKKSDIEFDESFKIIISKMMKIYKFTDSEPIEIGEVLMTIEIFHIISFDEISMFLPTIKFIYHIADRR
jgi:hypothetical protein